MFGYLNGAITHTHLHRSHHHSQYNHRIARNKGCIHHHFCIDMEAQHRFHSHIGCITLRSLHSSYKNCILHHLPVFHHHTRLHLIHHHSQLYHHIARIP